MAKIEKGSITYLFLEIITVSVAGIILWPLLDLLYHQGSREYLGTGRMTPSLCDG